MRMTQDLNSLNFDSIESAERYVEDVRDHYRRDHGEFNGRRTEEQQLIAEVTSDEARQIMDGVAAGIMAVRWSGVVDEPLPVNYETEVEKADFTWEDFRGEYERLMVGFGIITSRLHRDGYEVLSYADMAAADRTKVASVLLGDYLKHTALRFGVDTSGVMESKVKTIHTEDGDVERQVKVSDRDKVTSEKGLEANMKQRGYKTRTAQNVTVKISPKKYRELRKKYPEMKKSNFDDAVSFYTDVEKELSERE